MSAYQPGIPTGTVNLDVDYKNLQNNFQQLDTTYGVDHVAFSESLNNGYHKAVRLIPQATPAQVLGIGQLFSMSINDGYNTDQALFYETGGTAPANNLLIQLTRNFVPAANPNGYTFLPGGLILQWGIYNAPPGNGGSVTFSTANISFTTACFGVFLTMDRGSSTSSTDYDIFLNGPPTILGFKTNSGLSGSHNVYWMAIGK